MPVCASVLLLVLCLAGFWVWGCVLPLRVGAALSLMIWLVAGFVVGGRWVWLVLLCGLSGLSLDLGFGVGLHNTGLLGLVLAGSLVLGAFV